MVPAIIPKQSVTNNQTECSFTCLIKIYLKLLSDTV